MHEWLQAPSPGFPEGFKRPFISPPCPEAWLVTYLLRSRQRLFQSCLRTSNDGDLTVSRQLIPVLYWEVFAVVRFRPKLHMPVFRCPQCRHEQGAYAPTAVSGESVNLRFSNWRNCSVFLQLLCFLSSCLFFCHSSLDSSLITLHY